MAIATDIPVTKEVLFSKRSTGQLAQPISFTPDFTGVTRIVFPVSPDKIKRDQDDDSVLENEMERLRDGLSQELGVLFRQKDYSFEANAYPQQLSEIMGKIIPLVVERQAELRKEFSR